VQRNAVTGAADGRLLLHYLRTGRPGVAVAHLNNVSCVSLVLLEVGASYVVHATYLSWLEWNAIVVHDHLGLQRLVDYVGVCRTSVVDVLVVQHHVVGALERLVHIIDLSVRPNASSL
jgi:hypothetical protein